MTLFYESAPGGSRLLEAFRVLFGSGMLLFIVLGYLTVRRRNFAAHRAWMMRGYAIGLGAGTQTFTYFAGFLVFAGIGSALAPSIDRRVGGKARPILVAVAAIATVATTYLLALPPLFASLFAWTDAAKVTLALGLIAPLAVPMGMPFPLGIARVARDDGDLVPWAWGINGCASVTSAVLATLLTMRFGARAVVLIAAALYLLAAAVVRRSAIAG